LWLLVMLVILGLARTAGYTYSNSFSLPGTGSSAAAHILSAAAPRAAGDVDRVVFETSGVARVTDAAVRDRVESALSAVASIPHVRRVVSPYDRGAADQISPDGRTAYAIVTFNEQAWTISADVSKRLVDTASSAGGNGLTVAVSGQVAEGADRRSFGSAVLGLLVAAVILAVAFGSMLAPVLPLLTAVVSVGTAVGVVGLLSHAVSVPQFSTQLLTLIGLGVGVDYALFIVSRHRQGLLAGESVESSLVAAVRTSGRAVLFAGIIVCVAVLGMFALGVTFLYGVAVATAVGVLFTMTASLTLLPALLALVGHRVLPRRERARLAPGPQDPSTTGLWLRWARFVGRHPAGVAATSLVLIVVVAVPLFGLRLGSSDQGNDPVGSTTRRAYEMLARGFGPGFNGPLDVVAVTHNPAQRAAFERLVADLDRQAGVAKVLPPQWLGRRYDGGDIAVTVVVPATSPQDGATTALLDHLRFATVPQAVADSGVQVYIGGATATYADFAQVIASKLPLFVGIIIVLSFLVLAAVFRSLLIPLTAAVLNLLSIAAALGILVAAFQWNWLGPVVGAGRAGPIESFLPVMLFAILFGLSMDYQVFLLTRTQESLSRGSDNRAAVLGGISGTGRVITSAALIMIVVFGSFALGDNRVIKEFGLGLAGGVAADAMIIRTAVVPSLMILFGRANWWFPRALARLLPGIRVEPRIAVGVRSHLHPAHTR
jgi:RND superfamily putative drug exporter